MEQFLLKTNYNNLVLEDLKHFDLDETLDCGQAFRFEKQVDGSYIGVVKEKICRISRQNQDIVLHNTTPEEFQTIWFDYFDLGRNYSQIKTILSQDTHLAAAIAFAPGIRVLKQDSFEALCSFIISQNNNISRIKGIVKRLCEHFGRQLDDTIYAFPTPERLAACTIEDLAPLRSGFRAKYIIDAARKVSSGEVVLTDLATLPLEQARAQLIQITGVGAKVAECTLLYGSNRIECFPMDVWIKRAVAELFPDGLPEYALPIAGIAQQYIFHYMRNREKIKITS